MGVPLNLAGTDNPSRAKFKGRYSWAFSIALPSETTIATQLFRLPPSFWERASPAYIDYRIIVTIKRGAFKVDHT
jgi:hypothetical protein